MLARGARATEPRIYGTSIRNITKFCHRSAARATTAYLVDAACVQRVSVSQRAGAALGMGVWGADPPVSASYENHMQIRRV